jgi:hypothetical protein
VTPEEEKAEKKRKLEEWRAQCAREREERERELAAEAAQRAEDERRQAIQASVDGEEAARRARLVVDAQADARARGAEGVAKLHVHDAEHPAAREIREAKELAVQASQEATSRIIALAGMAPKPPNLGNCGIDWGMYSPENLDKIWLGFLYRCRHSHGDRRMPGELFTEVDQATGLPDSEARLAPRSQWISGATVALKTQLFPKKMAALLILRDDDGTRFANKSLWSIKSHNKQIEGVDTEPWRPDEKLAHGELEYRIKIMLMKWKDRGWVILEPPLKYNEKDTGMDAAGLPDSCHATPAALDEAERVIPGTPYQSGPLSMLEDAPQDMVDEARKNSTWAFREYKEQRKVGT